MSGRRKTRNALDQPKCIRCSCDLIEDFQLIFDDTGLDLELQKLLGICFDIDVKISLSEIQALCEDCLNELIDTYDLMQRNGGNSKATKSSPKDSDNKTEVKSVEDSDYCEIPDDELPKKGGNRGRNSITKNPKSTDNKQLGSKKGGRQSTCAEVSNTENGEKTKLEVQSPCKSKEADASTSGFSNKSTPMELEPKDGKGEGSAGEDVLPYIDYLEEFDEEFDFKEYKRKVLQSKFLDLCFPEAIKCRLCSEGVENHVALVKHTVDKHCGEDATYPCIIDGECESATSDEDLSFHLVFKHYDLAAIVIYCKCPECKRLFNDFPSFNKHSCYQKTIVSKSRTDCEQCGESFMTNKRYRFHLQFHLEKRRPKACFICDKLFRDQDEFFEHVMYSHEKIKGHLCLRCDRVFNSASLYKQHVSVHEAKRAFACTLCSRSYPFKHHLNKHMIANHGAESSYKCNICEQYFVSETVLNNHLLAHNKPKPTEVICCNTCGFVAENEKEAETHLEEHGDEDVHTVTEIIDRAYVCEFCELAYNSIDNLNKHRNSHSKKAYYCCMCSESFERYKELRTHKFSHQDYPDKRKSFPVVRHYACDIQGCTRNYLQMLGLKAHKRQHRSKKTVKCQKCRGIFNSTEELEDHMMKIHNGFNYDCHVCDKTYSSKIALGLHISRKHSINKLKCESCRYTYVTKEQLEAHKSTAHQDLTCEVCGLILRNLRNYQLHLRAVHKKEKRYFCKYCNKGFFKHCAVLYHEQAVHLKVKRYNCELCSYKTAYRGMYNMHMMAHRNENPFVCKICGSSFRKKFSLKQHMKRHNNTKDLKCPYEGCKLAFTKKTNLTLHVQSEHGEGVPISSHKKRTDVTRSFFAVPQSDVFIDDDDGLDFSSDEKQPKLKKIKEDYTDESDTDDTKESVKDNDSSPAVIVRKNYSDHDYLAHDRTADAYEEAMDDYGIAEVEVETKSE